MSVSVSFKCQFGITFIIKMHELNYHLLTLPFSLNDPQYISSDEDGRIGKSRIASCTYQSIVKVSIYQPHRNGKHSLFT